MRHIPNLFTLLNLVFGFMAIIVTLQNGITIQYTEDASQFIDVTENLVLASVYIAIAACIDFLDGFVARLMRASSGLLIASFPLIYWFSGNETAISLLMNQWVLYAVILLVSGLMVSRIPMMAFKFKERSIPANLPQVMLVVIAVAATLSLKWIAVPVIFLSYIILSLIFKKKT